MQLLRMKIDRRMFENDMPSLQKGNVGSREEKFIIKFT